VFVLVRTIGPAASTAARAILAFSDDTATVDECFRPQNPPLPRAAQARSKLLGLTKISA
jgi:hypothetical protein